MINEIRKKVVLLKGKKVKVKIDVGRNKIEEYTGIVDDCYDNIWLLKTDFGIKSFSYKDILIKNVILNSRL